MTALEDTPTLHPPGLRWSHHLALASAASLLLLGLAWELWLAPTGNRTLWLKVLPLLPAVWGLWHNRLYTYRWLSLAVWLYFTEGVVRAWGDPAPSSQLALLEVALCIVLFGACAWQVRARLRLARP